MTPPAPSAVVPRARLGITVVFLVVGLQLSAWFTQIPEIKSSLGLTDGELGLALLCPAVGALLSMQFSGRLARRTGSAPLVRIGGPLMALTIPLIGLARSLPALVAALLVIGLADGLLDVSMNAQAVAVESAAGRSVLQSIHAAFSLGTILGAAAGAGAIWAHISPLAFLTGIAIASVLASLAGTARLLPAEVDRMPAERAARLSSGSGWGPFVIVLGLLGAGCLYAGGAAENWTAVFLHTQRHLSVAVATCGYLGFTVAQLGGRLVGDRLHRRLGPVLLVRSASLVAGVGLLAALAAPGIAVPVAGFFVYGLGLSVLVPVITGAVGHGGTDRYGPDMVALCMTRYTTISYVGFLVGPAVIGWLAQFLGLTTALGTALLVLVATFALASYTRTALPGETGPAAAKAEGARVNATLQPGSKTGVAP